MARQAVMTVYDVQLGLAVHIKAPNGKYIIIDMGTGAQGSGNESPLLKRLYDDIGYMIITHPHLDHIDDILNFDRNAPTTLHRATSITNEEVMKDVRECDKPKFKKYCEVNDRYTSPVTAKTDPDNPDNYGGLSITNHSTSVCEKDNFNNFSSITVFELANCKIVVCGDNEKKSLDILMGRASFRESVKGADILVAPHHGRESGYQDDFVSLVNPALTIISDTKKSDASAVDKYREKTRGWKVWDRNGNSSERYCLTTRSDGNIKVTFGESEDPNYASILAVRLV
ncbi:MAG: MBL fold metallo-hydrolase [Bacteroidales bacterium]|nr:MBL fold metallo-hydrolase [Bacteroidales bacterium]